jgi:DnaJ-class molecular chaperone
MPASFREQRETLHNVEVLCEACGGTGFQAVKQPAEPGRRIYPAKCPKCGGKGRLRSSGRNTEYPDEILGTR